MTLNLYFEFRRSGLYPLGSRFVVSAMADGKFIFNQGHAAFLAEIPREWCPFSDKDHERQQWEAGWVYGKTTLESLRKPGRREVNLVEMVSQKKKKHSILHLLAPQMFVAK